MRVALGVCLLYVTGRKWWSACDYGAVGRELQLGEIPLNRAVLYGEGVCGAGGCKVRSLLPYCSSSPPSLCVYS